MLYIVKMLKGNVNYRSWNFAIEQVLAFNELNINSITGGKN